MSIKQRRFVNVAFLALAGGLVFGASRALSSPSGEADFRKAYPVTPAATGTFAGVALDKLVFPGLTLKDREDYPVADGGIQLAYAAGNEVGLVIRIAVAPDSVAARSFVDVELHSIQRVLPSDLTYGDYAFGDGDALLVGAIGNVAYSIRAIRDLTGIPAAKDVFTVLRANTVAGTPSYPSVSVSLPSEVQLGGSSIAVTSSLTPKLRAEGAYVASGPKLKPFGPGPVAVVAQVTDALGRVSTARATSVAR
jgi:hypothetical protein